MSMSTLGKLSAVAVVILLLVGIVFGPWIVIWAWNTLFGTLHLIDYTFWTWLAVLILGVFISPNVKVTRKD